MRNLKLALVGFGTVGQGLARLLSRKARYLEDTYDLNVEVTAIVDTVLGTVVDREGIDLDWALEKVEEDGEISDEKDPDTLNIIGEEDFDVLAEITFTDIETGEPAMSFIKEAIKSGKHVISTNKGPPALAMDELEELAGENGVIYRYEGTVLSGTPCINLGSEAMGGAEVKAIRGILNGTCNYILEEMEKGTGYEEALSTAQELGYAEADPTADVEGFDAATKIVILANKLMGASLKISDVDRGGISGLSGEDVRNPKKSGLKTKLIASAREEGGEVSVEVGVKELPVDDPLAGVNGVLNAVTFATDTLGDVTVIGPGAGSEATAQSLLADLLAINDRQ